MSQNSIESASQDQASLLHLLHKLNSPKFRANFKSFYTRVSIVFRDPAQLAPIFLDLCSLLHSLWDETRSGPNFIAPMSSLAKRSSGRLSRLLLQHSRDLTNYATARVEPDPHTVAVIQLSVPQESIPADLHGLMALFVFIETLILFLLPSWLNCVSAFTATFLLCAYATIGGDGTLTLVRQSEEIHDASTSDSASCAVLLGEDLTVVVKGPELVVEAITNGGFHLSRTFVDILRRPAWNAARDAVLEGFFQGLLYSMALLLVRWLGRLSLTPLLAILLGLPLVILSWKTYEGTLSTEFLRLTGRVVPFGGLLLLSMYTSAGNYVPRLGDLVQLAFLVNLLPFVLLAALLSIPSQNYALQAAWFLDTLGNPPVKKWGFETPAAAATFQCLVLCDGLARPTRDIDVRGVLDTLILDQRDVWDAWKARVADRIAHEVNISFAPTLPTFRDEARQKQLRVYLEEAQRAHEDYRTAYLSESSVQATQHPTS
ncbi:hypothetical protein PAXINDRAFT_101944 [Paxillus involutus ATCC 200175]|uniref:Uncharacterized protein n=1 Tax=Paxillus involutus ATCC 200175 TaxID=664439 RepID=A0A0C9T4V1_PAXIN|nr:hypothetical protein PAXINDRAFT_101944 [Paxillus involutus ATCC 200175]